MEKSFDMNIFNQTIEDLERKLVKQIYESHNKFMISAQEILKDIAYTVKVEVSEFKNNFNKTSNDEGIEANTSDNTYLKLKPINELLENQEQAINNISYENERTKSKKRKMCAENENQNYDKDETSKRISTFNKTNKRTDVQKMNIHKCTKCNYNFTDEALLLRHLCIFSEELEREDNTEQSNILDTNVENNANGKFINITDANENDSQIKRKKKKKKRKIRNEEDVSIVKEVELSIANIVTYPLINPSISMISIDFYECSCCDLKIQDMPMLQAHYEVHRTKSIFYVGNRQNQCVYAGHREMLKGIKRRIKIPYKCDWCNCEFKKLNKFKNHKDKIHHNKTLDLSCKLCEQTCNTLIELRNHYCPMLGT